MRAQRGFTIIEILIVIVVMAILLVLGVAGFRQTQAAARDATLRAQTESIARAMENFYKNGYVYAATTIPPGQYPSNAEILYLNGFDVPNLGQTPGAKNISTSWLSGVSPAALSRLRILSIWSLATADNSNVLPDLIYYQPYVFQPADGWGGDRYNPCANTTDKCSSFSLYYHSEVTDSVVEIKSEHQ